MWSDEKVEELKLLYANALPFSRIAAELGPGFTRNACISKAHRLGLPKRSQAIPRWTKPRTATERKPRGRPRRTAHSGETTDRDLSGVYEAAPEPLKISLVDLTADTCRYPIGYPGKADFGFCGHAVRTESPYCWWHHRLCHQ